MRLIDADNAKKVWGTGDDVYNKTGLGAIIRMILDACPDVDAVPVVHCKDCECWDDDPDTYGADEGPKGKCMRSFEMMLADDFCSKGERKETDHE